MKFIKRVFFTMLMVALSSITFSINANAASGYQGYAVYRDGAFYGVNWHAGIMTSAYSTYSAPVVHSPGFTKDVQMGTWAEFMTDDTFQGVYRPNTQPTDYYRDLFVSMGRNLASEQIAYNVGYQVYYDTSTAGSYVDDYEISSMRCDGVVEYIYEWFGFRVYGDDTYWDVTKNSVMGRETHSGSAISPKSQVNYLTLVTYNVPSN